MSSKQGTDLAVELLARPMSKFHLVAVSGSGMIGVAKLLMEKGCRVSGTDLQMGRQIPGLQRLGLEFNIGHKESYQSGADALVYSSAIRPENPERREAAARGIPQFRRAELLGALCQPRRLQVVCGTHGKTTTTLLLTRILEVAGRNPGYYIGADVPNYEFSAGWGTGAEIVIEADESDGTLDCYSPDGVLVLNIEEDHLDHYRDLTAIEEAFYKLAQRAQRTVVLCADDPVCRRLKSRLLSAKTYALENAADYEAQEIRLEAGRSLFKVVESGVVLGEVVLTLSGKHNVSNALGAIAMARSLGVEFSTCCDALGGVCGASRRFEIRHADAEYMVADDYAHHPSEISATLAAAKLFGRRRILAAFQPHRYSRSQHLQKEFATALAAADQIFLTDIYAAGEEPIAGVSGQAFSAEVVKVAGDRVCYEETLRGLKTRLSQAMEPGDCVMTLGAGDISKVAGELAEDLQLFREVQKLVDAESVFKLYEPMSRHTSLRVGGPAQMWFEPSNEEVLCRVWKFCRNKGVPVTTIGRGSNLLVRDNGIRGLCLHLGRPAFNRLEIVKDRIYAGAGLRLKQIVNEARKAGMGGFEFMEGIPGNLGGALRMNAGAMQSSTFEVVERVRYLNQDGEISELTREEVEVHYRHVPMFDRCLALGAWLKGVPVAEEVVREKLQNYSRKRWDSQPAAPSAGCTFKNPETIAAGRLIDELGLKDTVRGGARISAVHANFIVNDGGARASDVLELIELMRRKAREERGVELELEVIVLGE